MSIISSSNISTTSRVAVVALCLSQMGKSSLCLQSSCLLWEFSNPAMLSGEARLSWILISILCPRGSISKTNSASFPGLSYKRNKIFIPTIYMSLKQIPSFHQQCPVQNSVAMERHSSVLFRLNLHPRQADDGFVPSTQCSVPRAHQ